jgi:hypothetical protein
MLDAQRTPITATSIRPMLAFSGELNRMTGTATSTEAMTLQEENQFEKHSDKKPKFILFPGNVSGKRSSRSSGSSHRR